VDLRLRIVIVPGVQKEARRNGVETENNLWKHTLVGKITSVIFWIQNCFSDFENMKITPQLVYLSDVNTSLVVVMFVLRVMT